MPDAQPLALPLHVTDGRNGVTKGEATAYPQEPEAEADLLLLNTLYVRLKNDAAARVRAYAKLHALSYDKAAAQIVLKSNFEDPLTTALKAVSRVLEGTELENAWSATYAAILLARREGRGHEFAQDVGEFIRKPHSVKP